MIIIIELQFYMDKTENQQEQQQTTLAPTKSNNQSDHAYVAIKVANAKLSIANIENQKLKQIIVDKQDVIKENQRIIQELKRKLDQEQKTSKLNQWKISQMSQRLFKVQQLLTQLLGKKQTTTYTFQFGKYSTPNMKRSKLDKIKIKQGEVLQDSFNLNSYRSTKTQYISPQSRISYQKSIKFSTRSNHYESDQYKRYRKQKLKACNNLEDVLRLEKLIG